MRNIIINPGSEIKGGTLEQATKNANKWLKSIHDGGFREVVMEFEKECNGMFVYKFTHKVTNAISILEIHGFTEDECSAFIFRPRVYWNGSSTANCGIADWLTDEYTYKIVFIKKHRNEKFNKNTAS